MPDDSTPSDAAGADHPVEEEPFSWSAARIAENGVREAVTDEPLPLDLPTPEPAATNGVSPTASSGEQRVVPASERAAELEHEHWRERAIVWRERAMGAELVAKMLQRNLDDLRANLEDLRRKVEANEANEAARAAAIASSETPWRRFAREMYDKYMR